MNTKKCNQIHVSCIYLTFIRLLKKYEHSQAKSFMPLFIHFFFFFHSIFCIANDLNKILKAKCQKQNQIRYICYTVIPYTSYIIEHCRKETN